MKKILSRLLIVLIVGFVYFYVVLPPINLTSMSFWMFVIILLLAYYLTTLSLGVLIDGSFSKVNVILGNKKVNSTNYTIPLIIGVIIVIMFLTNFILSPLFISSKYAKRIVVDESKNFVEDVKEINLNSLPVIDKDSSIRLGDRVMGQMPELVSQFDVSNLYTQINYKNEIVRVTPLEYNDFFKYVANRKDGIKGYITVNSVTGESELIKLDKGMKYVDSAILGEDLNRKLRFDYPTKIFGQKTFEIDDEGNPYWIVPVIKYSGINIRKEVKEVIILNPINGKSKLYDVSDVPSWVDHVYSAELIIEQITDWGKFRGGFFNSIIGQKNVVAPTDGYNYTVMNDDVYLYTGITSAVADESNIGFILTNMRTKETNYYAVPGAEEYSAMASAEGQVQQMNYKSTFPLLINLNNKPTYFVSLKDNAGLVKMYGLVDVVDYQKVVVTDSSKGIEEAINKYLGDKVISNVEDIEENIVITSITMAIMEGNSYYYITDKEDNKYISNIKVSNNLPFLKVGDEIKVRYPKIEEYRKINYIK